MDLCDFGVVLTSKPNHPWHTVVPVDFVYNTAYELAIRRMIDRQLAFKRLQQFTDYKFAPCAIILDNVDMKSLDLSKIGVDNYKHLQKMLNDLNIIVETNPGNKYAGKKLFPRAWQWSSISD